MDRQINIQIGDKVRFLNATGGGKVVRFKGKDQVLIEDEDGFEIPVLIRECVVIQDETAKRKTAAPAPRTYAPAPDKKQPEPKVPETPKPAPTFYHETSEGERINASLAFLPLDAKNFQQSRFEAYFINDSNYFLYINYMYCQNGIFISHYDGLVEPGTKVFLEEIGKEELNDMARIAFQMIAFKRGKSFAMKEAYSIELRPDIVKFYKLHCFIQNDFFYDDALVFPVVTNDSPARQLHIDADELRESMCRKIEEDNRHEPQPAKVKEHPKEEPIVVDLHISALLDNTSGMSSGDLLNYQLDKFREVLDAHAKDKGCKIIFIHGKGEGVLRNAILKELKNKYATYYFQDASFREYGYGATQVTIK